MLKQKRVTNKAKRAFFFILSQRLNWNTQSSLCSTEKNRIVIEQRICDCSLSLSMLFLYIFFSPYFRVINIFVLIVIFALCVIAGIAIFLCVFYGWEAFYFLYSKLISAQYFLMLFIFIIYYLHVYWIFYHICDITYI